MRLLLIAVLFAAPLSAQTAVSQSWPRVPPTEFVELPYPLEALAARVTGAVIVRVTTDAAGRVSAAEALSGPDALKAPALANIRKWRLSPGVTSGAVVYRFEIDSAACNDDRRSFFRLVRPNLALITACSSPGRPPGSWLPSLLEWRTLGSTPRYPALARNALVAGVVVLDLSLDENGAVVDSRSLTELPMLTEAAIAHSKQWRASPGSRRRSIIVYEFALDNHACERPDQTAFWWVTTDYLRLSGCLPVVER